MGIENTGIVEKDIQRSKGTYGLLDRATAFVSLTHVSAQEDGLAAGFQNFHGHGMAALLVAAGDGDFRSLFGEKQGRSLADAGGSAGDECDFVFQTHVSTP